MAEPARIWVVDDASAANDWERELLESAAPDVKVRVLTVAQAAAEHGARRARRPGGHAGRAPRLSRASACQSRGFRWIIEPVPDATARENPLKIIVLGTDSGHRA